MRHKIQGLDLLPPGESACIESLTAEGLLRYRLQDLGFVKGSRIKALFSGPGGDPAAYLIRGSVIALRREDARKILVLPCFDKATSDAYPPDAFQRNDSNG